MKHKEYVQHQLNSDPQFREEYEALKRESHFRRSLMRARLDANLTQVQLAELIGTKQSAIARLETGSAKPSFDMLGRLATALNVSFEVMPGLEVRVHEQEVVSKH